MQAIYKNLSQGLPIAICLKNWNLKYDVPFCVLIFSLVFEAIIRLSCITWREKFFLYLGGWCQVMHDGVKLSCYKNVQGPG